MGVVGRANVGDGRSLALRRVHAAALQRQSRCATADEPWFAFLRILTQNAFGQAYVEAETGKICVMIVLDRTDFFDCSYRLFYDTCVAVAPTRSLTPHDANACFSEVVL